jgi:CRISPR-associated protein Csm1
LAFTIREEFKRFTCANPCVNISGGFAVQNPKYPLYHMAELAHEGEKRAKENVQEEKGKDSIALFYKTPVFSNETAGVRYAVKWEEAATVRKLKQMFVDTLMQQNGTGVYEMAVPRGLFFKLREVVEKKRTTGQLYLPHLYYILSRFEQVLEKKEEGTGWPELKKQLLGAETVNYLAPVLTWLEMLTRKETQ